MVKKCISLSWCLLLLSPWIRFFNSWTLFSKTEDTSSFFFHSLLDSSQLHLTNKKKILINRQLLTRLLEILGKDEHPEIWGRKRRLSIMSIDYGGRTGWLFDPKHRLRPSPWIMILFSPWVTVTGLRRDLVLKKALLRLLLLHRWNDKCHLLSLNCLLSVSRQDNVW